MRLQCIQDYPLHNSAGYYKDQIYDAKIEDDDMLIKEPGMSYSIIGFRGETLKAMNLPAAENGWDTDFNEHFIILEDETVNELSIQDKIATLNQLPNLEVVKTHQGWICKHLDAMVLKENTCNAYFMYFDTEEKAVQFYYSLVTHERVELLIKEPLRYEKYKFNSSTSQFELARKEGQL